MKITFEQFEKHLKDIAATLELQENILLLSRDYNKTHMDEFQLWFPSLVDNVIKLLSSLTNDTGEWIEYWVYELECGKKAEKYNITDENDIPIPLSSIEDLWNLLIFQENNGEGR